MDKRHTHPLNNICHETKIQLFIQLFSTHTNIYYWQHYSRTISYTKIHFCPLISSYFPQFQKCFTFQYKMIEIKCKFLNRWTDFEDLFFRSSSIGTKSENPHQIVPLQWNLHSFFFVFFTFFIDTLITLHIWCICFRFFDDFDLSLFNKILINFK